MIDTKYLVVYSGSHIDYPPLLYLDVFVVKGDTRLVRTYRTNNSLRIHIGAFGKHLNIWINYKFRERPMTEEEKMKREKFLASFGDIE